MNVLLHVECYLSHPLSDFAFRKTWNSFSASKAGPTTVTLAFRILIWLGPLWPASFLSCPCRTWRPSDEPHAAGTDIDRGRCKFPRLRFVGVRMKLIMYRPEVRGLKPGQPPSRFWTNCQCHQISPLTNSFSTQLSRSLATLAFFLPNCPWPSRDVSNQVTWGCVCVHLIIIFFGQFICFLRVNCFPLDSFCFCPDSVFYQIVFNQIVASVFSDSYVSTRGSAFGPMLFTLHSIISFSQIGFNQKHLCLWWYCLWWVVNQIFFSAWFLAAWFLRNCFGSKEGVNNFPGPGRRGEWSLSSKWWRREKIHPQTEGLDFSGRGRT